MVGKFQQSIVDKFQNELETFHGRVTGDVQIWNETHVSGGGSGKNATPVTSQNTAWTQFFLKSETGLEMEIKVPKALGVRTGHRVSAVRFRDGTPALLNHDLGRLHWFESEVKNKLVGPEFRMLPPIISWVLGLFLTLLWVAPGLIYLIIVYSVRASNSSKIAKSISNFAAHSLNDLNTSSVKFSTEFGEHASAEFINDILFIAE